MAMRYGLPITWLLDQPDEIVALITELDRIEQRAEE